VGLSLERRVESPLLKPKTLRLLNSLSQYYGTRPSELVGFPGWSSFAIILDLEVMRVGIEDRQDSKTVGGQYEMRMARDVPDEMREDLRRQGLWPLKPRKK
jgi:hypothetical protein